MIVSKSKLEGWKALLEHGEYQEIEKVSGMNARQISRALRKGTMELKTFFVLNDYFTSKEAEIKKLKEQKPLPVTETE
jgi:alkylated DNA nucleotide flippase Atl1